MPRLEHANIILAEIEPTLNFLKAAFPMWSVRGGGKDEWYGYPREWLHFGGEDTYLTLNSNGQGKLPHREDYHQGMAHLCFEVSSVVRLTERLEQAGFTPSHHGTPHPHRRNVYYIDDQGLEFEFVEYFSDLPEEKNLYQ